MTRFHKVTPNEDGWSDWQYPVMKSYKMACCDCGLVHDMEFEVHEVGRTRKDGNFIAKLLKAKKYRVAFRARRNNRSSAAMRRGK